MRRAARVDANQAEIVGRLIQLGASVALLHRVGGGVPDLLIGCGGGDVQAEVKTAKGKMRPGQIEYRENWRGRPPVVLRTLDDCVALVNRMRSATWPKI